MSAPQVEDPTLLTPSEATMPDIESQPDTLRMTVMLPFMLSAQQPDKQAQLTRNSTVGSCLRPIHCAITAIRS